ncbi:FadR/GntR family transcriptional regulator [Izhakiella australiensis]|nr:FadR/GntR family transcriptional regulator [Izhakiella australiensis]
MQFDVIASGQRGLDLLIASDIARKIMEGKFNAGDVLPSEVELCNRFGVSRTALREALKLLSSKGLLESRPKIGTRVRERSHWNILDVQLLEWMKGIEATEDMYHQFLDFRRVIEPHATRLAAVNASKEQRIELSRIYREMCDVSAAPFDAERWLDVDTAFHRLIFFSSGNCFYMPFGNVLATVFKWFISYSSKEGGTCMDDHRKIYEAIMMGDADAAQQASLGLMQSSKHRL